MSAFRWNPADYASNSSAQFAWAQRLLGRLGLTGSESVLDVGSGDGKITAEVAKVVPRGRVVGLDSSPEMVAFARTTFPVAQWPQLSFSQGDACSLSYDGDFDIVFSNAALHWIADHLSVLRGMSRALRPGGRLILSFGGRGNAASILPVFDEVARLPEWADAFEGMAFPYHFPGTEEYGDWLAAAGFQWQRLELVPQDMTHTNREGLLGWVRTTWIPWTQRLKGAQRDRFVAEIVDRYLDAYPPDPDGRTHLKMMRLEVEARKV
jgi:trans-aconitate methyltransferase